MIFLFNENGTLKEFIEEQPLVQSSRYAYSIHVGMDGLNDYSFCQVEYKRSDGEVSGDIALSSNILPNGEKGFSGNIPDWALQERGKLQITIRILQTNSDLFVKALTMREVDVLEATSKNALSTTINEEQYEALFYAIDSARRNAEGYTDERIERVNYRITDIDNQVNHISDDVDVIDDKVDSLTNSKLDKIENRESVAYAYINNRGTDTRMRVEPNIYYPSTIVQRDGYDILTSDSNIETSNIYIVPNNQSVKRYVRGITDSQQKIIDSQAKRIKQLELASEGTILSTYENVSEVSYNRLIGENVLPYGTLDKVGGMTYKSENLAVWDSSNVKTRNVDISYTINENGTITLNGTNTTDGGSIIITLKESLSAGTYRVALFNKAITDGATNNAVLINGSWSYALGLNAENYSASLTITETITQIVIRINNTTVFENYTIKPMIVSGTTAPSEYSKGFDGLRNTAVSEVISNGANLISSEFVQGGFSNETGELVLGNYTTIVTKDYIKALPNTTYTFSINESKSCYFGEYDKDYNFLGVSTGPSKKNTITTKSNTAYIRLKVWDSAGTTLETATNIMLNYGSEVLPYTPYKEPIHYAVPPEVQALQGYGIGINETYKNYIDYERKVFVRMVEALTINGSESWIINTTNDNYLELQLNVNIGQAANPSGNNIITTFSEQTTNDRISCLGNALYWRIPTTKQSITGTTLSEIKKYLANNPVLVIYPLATPVETDISQYLTQDNVIEMEALGSLTFENEHQQAVPNEITYQERNV